MHRTQSDVPEVPEGIAKVPEGLGSLGEALRILRKVLVRLYEGYRT